jgi:hypothetical protein
MVMPPSKARRMSPRAPTRMLAPEAEMPAPPASPGRRLRVGFWVEAMPALCSTRRKIPFRMSWRKVVCAARVGHRIPWSTSEGQRGAPQSHGRGVGGQHADAKAMAEVGADFSALEFQRRVEGKHIQPCQGWAARAAEQSGTSTLPFCGAGVEGFQQGVGSSLCRVPRKLALCCDDSSQAVRAHLPILWRPQSANPIM